VNLENGYFGRMSRTVIEEYQRNIELINTSNSVYVRQRFEQHDNLDIRAQLAWLVPSGFLLTTPFEQRRARLETLMSEVAHPLHITRTTRDRDAAVRWLQEFEGAGLDGVVAKPLDQPYAAGTRTLIKVKHARTADVVALGYRIHKSGSGVGSLLVGLFDSDGTLRQVGGVAAWSDVRRRELIDELAPLVERDDAGAAVTDEGERSRFSGSKDVSFVRLRPERVLEVRYDQLEGSRFRHTVQFARWRPDRDTRSCTYDQLDTVAGYDLADVLG
jgi:ATP-dependent DNA ligase